MLFDLNSRYLACYGREIVNIISLKSAERKIVTEVIDQEIFNQILDVQLSSKEDGTYRCDLACLLSSSEEISQTVQIYTLGQEVDSRRALQFDKDTHNQGRPIVRISQDF